MGRGETRTHICKAVFKLQDMYESVEVCEMAVLGSIQMDETGRSATEIESCFMVVEREQNKALRKL